MDWAVQNLAGSVSGTPQAARVAKREVDRKEPARQKRQFRDEFDQLLETSEAEGADAVRSLKDNSQEEAHEDRREHGGQDGLPIEPASPGPVYSPKAGAVRRHTEPRPRLDLEG